MVSPLEEVEKESLSELFNRDPEKLSDQDLLKIVTALRSQRKQWQLTEAAKTPRGSKAKASAKPSLSASELDALLDGI